MAVRVRGGYSQRWLLLELTDLTMVSVGGRVQWSWAGIVPNLFFFPYKKDDVVRVSLRLCEFSSLSRFPNRGGK